MEIRAIARGGSRSTDLPDHALVIPFNTSHFV
jgi:hypothetical protein